MANKFSVILEYNKLNCEFINNISSLINQSIENVEIIIVYSDISGVTELKKLLGDNHKIKFCEKKDRNQVFAMLDSECLIFCDGRNTFKHNGLEDLYELHKKKNKDIIILNKNSFRTNNDNIFTCYNLDICNLLLNTDFIKNSDITFDELCNLSSASLLKMMCDADIAIINHNPYLKSSRLQKDKLSEWKRYLSAFDEFYKYLSENDSGDKYINQFSDFYLQYIYDLFCLKNNEELNKIIKFVKKDVPSVIDIIKNNEIFAQYDILKKYFVSGNKKSSVKYSKELNIAIYCDNNNAPFCMVSLLSLIRHANKGNLHNIHILHTGLSSEIIRKSYHLAQDNVRIFFTDISEYLNDDKVNIGNIELIIPQVFAELDKVIYIKNYTLCKFDISELLKERFSECHIIGISKDDEKFDLQNIILFVFDIKKCLEEKISEQLFLFCCQDDNNESYATEYIKKCSNKYNFVYLSDELINTDNIDSYEVVEWLNYAGKSPFYEWLLYNLFDKGK